MQTEEDQNISRADETKRPEIVEDKVENFLDTNNEDRMHDILENSHHVMVQFTVVWGQAQVKKRKVKNLYVNLIDNLK